MGFLRSKKAFAVLAALILLAAFGLTLFHSHAGDGGPHECPVCRVVQAFGLLFAFVIIAFVMDLSQPRGLVKVSVLPFKTRFPASKLRDRSPP
ncbi:MAG TPA: hypothetical protein VJC08_00525, partial [bacterium]|nr:hypothetical protein [bacterium]